MVLYHGDNNGLVLPPTVASVQVVIVPILKTGADNEKLINKAYEIKKELRAAGIRIHVDDRDNYTSGWKFNDWEVKGVPLRFELGHKDMDSLQVTSVWRVNGKKEALPWADLVNQTKLRFG